MVDISDEESVYEDFEIDSTGMGIRPAGAGQAKAPESESGQSQSMSSLDIKTMLPPDRLAFMNIVRKRSIKEREKEKESQESQQITADFVHRFHNKDFSVPFPQKTNQSIDDQKLQSMIFRKFHDKKSINKIIQKTAKLQKNLRTNLESHKEFDESTGEAIRF